MAMVAGRTKSFLWELGNPLMRALILASVLGYTVSLLAQSYEIEDLQLLFKQKQYEQLLAHVTDIPPTKRTPAWNTLVKKTVSIQFDTLLQKNNEKKIFSFLHTYLNLLPQLKNDKLFMQKRAAFGLKYYSQCFSYNDAQCHSELLNFVSLDPNPNYAFKVAKQVRLRMSDSKAIYYFSLLSEAFTDQQCKDSDLSMSVEKALTMKPKSGEATLAKKIAFGLCHKSLKSAIKNAIRANKNGMINSCPQAIKHQSITGIELSKCKRHLSL